MPRNDGLIGVVILGGEYMGAGWEWRSERRLLGVASHTKKPSKFLVFFGAWESLENTQNLQVALDWQKRFGFAIGVLSHSTT